jgi:hypothetical protein
MTAEARPKGLMRDRPMYNLSHEVREKDKLEDGIRGREEKMNGLRGIPRSDEHGTPSEYVRVEDLI